MIATIEREIVEKKKWLSQEEMSDMIAVSSSAPGGVAINSAAYIGYRLGGLAGAAAAVTGIAVPSFIIVLILSGLSVLFQDQPKVAAALKGVHAAVIALIAVAAVKMWRSSVLDTPTFLIAGCSVALLLFAGIHPLYLIIGGPFAGCAVMLCKRKAGIESRTEQSRATPKPELQYPEYYI